jgi:hypothetical protein
MRKSIFLNPSSQRSPEASGATTLLYLKTSIEMLSIFQKLYSVMCFGYNYFVLQMNFNGI